ncbi:hypothetical protein [Zhihengliuella salsuginis]|uniref:Uncharacterized protein n=1 Tax=Zhihengliuella salsuginis TaxID=578222 RepID=A0ABQ3GGH8_9MICC|nr:hypothetical protein [Zhihengliuella salsuginis]GHD04925.1 hypothetical protein GCM10008096_12990 [Zhihengliuella salsuginis]
MWDSSQGWADLVHLTALGAERAYAARDVYARILGQTAWDSPAGRAFLLRVEELFTEADRLARQVDEAHGRAVAAAATAELTCARGSGGGPGDYGSRAGWG